MDHHDQQEYDHCDTADHSQLFSHTGENEVGVLSGKDCGTVLRIHSGEPSGGKSQLALSGLPGDAPAVRIDGGVIRGNQALLLIIFQKVGPEQWDSRSHSGTAQSKPVQPDAQHEEHRQEDQQQDRGASRPRKPR